MKLSIRKATLKDLPSIPELNHKLFLYEKPFYQFYDENWPFKQGRKYFEERIKNDIVLVTETEEKIVAYICGSLDTYSFRTLNPIAEIENMYVEEEFRGKRIGTKLIAHFEKEAKEKGAKLIKVSAFIKNSKAINFYEKMGFEKEEIALEKIIEKKRK